MNHSARFLASLFTMLIVKVSLGRTAFFAFENTNAFNLPQDFVKDEARTARHQRTENNFKKYVELLDIFKQEFNRGIRSAQSDGKSKTNNFPIFSKILSTNNFRNSVDGTDRKFKIQTLKLLNFGLTTAKGSQKQEDSRNSEDFDWDIQPGDFQLQFPRQARAAKNVLSRLDPQLMNAVLQRWGPRLESSKEDKNMDLTRFEDILSDRLRGRQDISVGLDLDALTGLVDDNRRKDYQGKLQSTLKKLKGIGKK